jgi:hypothetical protein
MKLGGSLAYIAVQVNRYVYRTRYIKKLMHCEIRKFIPTFQKKAGFTDPHQVGRNLYEFPDSDSISSVPVVI